MEICGIGVEICGIGVEICGISMEICGIGVIFVEQIDFKITNSSFKLLISFTRIISISFISTISLLFVEICGVVVSLKQGNFLFKCFSNPSFFLKYD